MARYLDEQGLAFLWQKIKSLQWNGQTGGEDPYLKHLPANFCALNFSAPVGAKISLQPILFAPSTANRSVRYVLHDETGDSSIDGNGILYFNTCTEDVRQIEIDIIPVLWAGAKKTIIVNADINVAEGTDDYLHCHGDWKDENEDVITDTSGETIYLK